MGGWALETSLDVEYAHAIAPGANILLVETPVAETEGVTGLPQMMAAEKYVIDNHLGDVITQSFGATEQTFQTGGKFNASLIYGLRYAYQDAFKNHVTVLAASAGTVTVRPMSSTWPASCAKSPPWETCPATCSASNPRSWACARRVRPSHRR